MNKTEDMHSRKTTAHHIRYSTYFGGEPEGFTSRKNPKQEPPIFFFTMDICFRLSDAKPQEHMSTGG